MLEIEREEERQRDREGERGKETAREREREREREGARKRDSWNGRNRVKRANCKPAYYSENIKTLHLKSLILQPFDTQKKPTR